MGLFDESGDDTPPRSPLSNEGVHVIDVSSDEDDELVEVEDVDEFIEMMGDDEEIKELSPAMVTFSEHTGKSLTEGSVVVCRFIYR